MYLRLKKEYVERHTSKIPVIKDFRKVISGTSLKDAKRVVDTIFEKGYINFDVIRDTISSTIIPQLFNKSEFLEVVNDVNEDSNLDQLKDLVYKCLDDNECELAEDLLNVYNRYKHRK